MHLFSLTSMSIYLESHFVNSFYTHNIYIECITSLHQYNAEFDQRGPLCVVSESTHALNEAPKRNCWLDEEVRSE